MALKNQEKLAKKRGIVRLLYGEDGFRVRERLKFYIDAFVKQYDPQSLSVARFWGPNFEVNDFHRDLASPPLLAPKRLFVIYDFSKLKLDSMDEQVLLRDIKNLKDNSIVFLENIDDKAFRGLSFYKKIKLDSAEYFPQLKGFHLEKEVRERLEKGGYKIEPSALKNFLSLVGNDFWKINSEIQKLIAFVSSLKRKVLWLKDIETVTISDFADNCFKLIDYLTQKDKGGTVKELANLRSSGTEDEIIFYHISSNFRQLLEVKSLLEARKSSISLGHHPLISELLNIHPYRAQKLCAASQNFTSEELKKTHNLILESDFKIKTGRLKIDLALDLLLIKILL